MQPYSNTDMATTWKNSHFVLSEGLDFWIMCNFGKYILLITLFSCNKCLDNIQFFLEIILLKLHQTQIGILLIFNDVGYIKKISKCLGLFYTVNFFKMHL